MHDVWDFNEAKQLLLAFTIVKLLVFLQLIILYAKNHLVFDQLTFNEFVSDSNNKINKKFLLKTLTLIWAFGVKDSGIVEPSK